MARGLGYVAMAVGGVAVALGLYDWLIERDGGVTPLAPIAIGVVAIVIGVLALKKQTNSNPSRKEPLK